MWMTAALCAVACGLAPASVASAAELPDGRGYEQVTPEEKLGTEAYQPPVEVDVHYEEEIKHEFESNTQTQNTFQAAVSGGELAYVEGPTEGGNESDGYNGGNEYLSTRQPDGEWSQRLLSPEGAPTSVFQAFTPNLSTAFVSSHQPLSPSAPGYGKEDAYGETYNTLYTVSTSGGSYVPFFSVKPPYRGVEQFGTVPRTAREPQAAATGGCGYEGCLVIEGASTDDKHLLFAADDALTGASEGRPAAEGGESYFEFGEKNNLYESVSGQLRLVNVLPDGTTHINATFGGLKVSYPVDETFFSHAISNDGSRIFWTDLNTGHIYMREDGTRTVEISPSGTYQAAKPDGSAVLYTNGNLYEYEVESGHTTDLTPGITVDEVVGTSENDDYIYYLTSEMTLAVLHDGVSTQVTTTPILLGTGQIRAEVAPDGRSIVFMVQELKAYPHSTDYVYRVEVYDTDTKTLYCASCTPLSTTGYLQESNYENVYQPRWISADGSRVFFVSLEGLVPQDVNEEQDVYEWVRPGTGGCTDSGGCVYLLSGGTSVGQSSFLDASESGEDVFMVTRANLDGSDEDTAFDIYDVRLGAQRPPAEPACSGTGCQGIPSAPPIFATPSSVTYEGVGNFAPPVAETKAKPKPKKQKKSKAKKKKPKHRKKSKKDKARKAGGRRRSSSRKGRS
jgi:hypothetical protein